MFQLNTLSNLSILTFGALDMATAGAPPAAAFSNRDGA